MADPISVSFKDLVNYQQQRSPQPPGAPATVSDETVRDYGRDHGWDADQLATAIVKFDGGDGAVDEHEFEQLTQEFNGAADKQLLDGLYQQILGRDTDPTGLAAWGPKVAELRQAGKSPAEIEAAMRPFIERSPENQINHGDDFVQQAYQQGLGREAKPEEVASWKAQMQQARLAGQDMTQIHQGVIDGINGSPEARQRAATQPAASASGVVPDSGLEGQHGGQCVVFVENQTGHHFPVEGAKQMLDPGMHPGYTVVGSPQPGDVFVCTGGQWGHTGIVKSVNPDGSLVVEDSNSQLDEVIHTHTVPAGYAQGYLRRDPSQATIPQG